MPIADRFLYYLAKEKYLKSKITVSDPEELRKLSLVIEDLSQDALVDHRETQEHRSSSYHEIYNFLDEMVDNGFDMGEHATLLQYYCSMKLTSSPYDQTVYSTSSVTFDTISTISRESGSESKKTKNNLSMSKDRYPFARETIILA